MNEEIIKKLAELKKSKFRSKFFLDTNDLNYINKKGLEKIIEDAKYFIEQRLKDKEIKNDGRQTPYKGHPVFKAQHATATCCRKCIEKWHKIKKNKMLEKNEIEYILNIIINWIKNELTTKEVTPK